MIKRTNLDIFCETNKRSLMNYPDRVYICRQCKAAFGHQVVWCPNCPGKCERLEYTSYDELFRNTGPDWEWGETRLWREYRSECQTNFDKERKKGVMIPCTVYFWVDKHMLGKFFSLYEEYGYLDNYEDGPNDTDVENVYEFKFKFPSWGDAHKMVYRKFVGAIEERNEDFIFNNYRKRMRSSGE